MACSAAARYLAGDYAESIPAYKMALQLRQDQPATLAYFIARAYGKAGDPVTGMRWLRQSMQWGYSYLDEARTDEALKSLAGQPGFSDLLGIVDASRMSRTQGWRYDLAFLARWAKVKPTIRFAPPPGIAGYRVRSIPRRSSTEQSGRCRMRSHR